MDPTSAALGWRRGGTGFPVPSLRLGLDFRGGDSGRELWATGNWDLVIKPSCKFSPLSSQLFFPPSFLPKIIETPGRGRDSLPPGPAGGGGGPAIGPGPRHRRHTPWAWASTPPPPPQPRGSNYISSSLPAPSLCGSCYDLVPERTSFAWGRAASLDQAS